MKIKQLNVVLRALMMSALLSVVALEVHAYDGWSQGTIDRIRIQGSRVLINQAGATNPGGCPNTDYLHLDQSDTPYSKNMFALILAAYLSGKQVSLALTGCEGGYPRITEVWGV
ncbi:MAG: hypothetical protein MK096_15000 [Oleiphilaceae bacterium]|nr:hypothetical protein [Oleiphilaceae bacterium]